jgi:cytidine deaminase
VRIDGQALVLQAREAAARAYAPYSQFAVGAALLGESGKIYTGCNVENASYGLTICAERAAVFQAVAQGERRFQAIAVSLPGAATPCGACRQVLHEFAPDLKIFISDESGRLIHEFTLADLLPGAFGSGNLSNH